MKRLLLLSANVLLSFLLIPVFAFADTMFLNDTDLENAAVANGGVYTLTASDSPVIFPYGITVSRDVTINIDEGVKIYLGENRSININNGTFNVYGTSNRPVVITGRDGLYFGQILFNSPTNSVFANLNNVEISNGNYCSIFGRATSVFKNVKYSGCRTVPISITLGADVNVTLDNVIYSKIFSTPIPAFIYMAMVGGATPANPVNVTIINSSFQIIDGYAIQILDQSNNNFDPAGINIKLSNNAFVGEVKDSSFIMLDSLSQTFNIDARNNYWGHESGPYVFGTFPITEGPLVQSNIRYIPFLTVDPNTRVIEECCSSVIFLPGIQGSRLYNKRGGGSEDQLWEPNITADIPELYGDSLGNTKPGIYTRDIIERTNILPVILEDRNENFYKSISDNLRNLKTNGVINEWLSVPYDWRNSVDDILNEGIKLENTTLNLVDEVVRMAGSSQTGQVTIVTHSNGGLLAKMLVKKLEDQGRSDLVDNVVMVAAPQIGTPNAIYALLHGLEFKGGFKFIATQKYNRELAKNIEMTYSLLPSSKYFENGGVTVLFDSSITGDYSNLISKYGDTINSYDELKQFVIGNLDGRPEAEFDKTSQIGKGNEYLYNKAEAVHDQIDNYEFPSNIKLHQVSGTGAFTNQFISYENRKVLGKDVFTPYLVKNLYGDGTVSNKSSGVMIGDSYYFDLYKFNKDFNKKIEHAYLFEASPIIDFVNKVVQEQDLVTNYIVQELPDYSTLETTIVKMHSPVDIHLYDNAGQHTGPVYIDGQKFIEENIPNSKYEELGETVSIIITGNEEYKLKLDGYDNGVFTLDIEKFTGNTKTNSASFVDLEANPDLSSEIIISPTIINNQILIDTNSDGVLDLQASSDGKVKKIKKENSGKRCLDKDNHKKEKDKHKEKKKCEDLEDEEKGEHDRKRYKEKDD